MTLMQRLTRMYTWRELPGWRHLYDNTVGGWKRDKEWANVGRRTIRGKLHGFEMDLDLSNWSQRLTYFLGRFYDFDLQFLLLKVLKPGDRVLDIGANIGMITLLASRLVGPQGRVDSVEPNPVNQELILSSLATNGITNVNLHAAALGDVEAVLPLAIPDFNSGEATLAEGVEAFGGKAHVVMVPVRVGDQVVAEDPRPPMFIKIDVEGFEYHVLSGLQETLSKHRPLVTTEVVDTHLARDGRTAADLFAMMSALGYDGYNWSARRANLLGRRLSITPITPAEHASDVLWIARNSASAERVAPFLTAASPSA